MFDLCLQREVGGRFNSFHSVSVKEFRTLVYVTRGMELLWAVLKFGTTNLGTSPNGPDLKGEGGGRIPGPVFGISVGCFNNFSYLVLSSFSETIYSQFD